MAVTTGLVHHQGRLVWLGVDVSGIEPLLDRAIRPPSWV